MKLRAALDYANLSNPLTMKVFRHSCLLGEGLRDPLFDRVPADNWDQTKTITALITGIAQDQGLVDIDAPIGSYLPADLGDAAHRYLREFQTAARTNCGYGFLTFLNRCQPGQAQVDVSIPTRRDAGGVPWVASAPADMIFTDGVGIRTFVIPSLDLVVTRSGTDMPDEVRATIENSGPYDWAPKVGVDATHFLHPLDAPVGTYLSVGPRAPQGCNPLGSSSMSLIFRALSPVSWAPRRDPTATDALLADGRRSS